MTNSFSDNYEILEQIGAGGMSVIYKGRQSALNKLVAVKMLHSHLLNDQSIRRFQQEAKAVSSLRHPNVIAVHDFGLTENGQPFMVMDLIEGQTLSDFIAENGALPLPLAVEIFLPVCDALQQAHSQGILHRDLKPGNIMISSTGKDGYSVHLLDFGLAKVLDAGPGGIAQKLTQTGELFGSPLYMSPEQCMGRTLDERSDIYSLGCIFYESLVGWPPLQGDTVIDTIFKHLNDAPVSINEARADINFPQSVVNLVDKLLAKQPEERYQSVSQVHDQLLGIQSGAFAAPQVKPRGAVASRKMTGATWMLLASSIALCVALGLFVVSALQLQEINRETSNKTTSTVYQPLPMAPHSVAITMDSASNLPPADARGRLDLSGKSKYKELWQKQLDLVASRGVVKDLDLSDSNVSDISPLAKSTTLKSLSLSNTALSPDALKKVAQIENLESLSLDNTQVDADTLKALGGMSKLSSLNLRDTKTNDEGLISLAGSKSLRELAISNTDVTTRGIEAISHLPLTRLYMWDTRISADGLAPLANCKTLTYLAVSRAALNDSSIRAISNLPNLYYLELYHIPTLKDAELHYLVNLRGLQILYIEDCPLSDACSKDLVKLPLKKLCMNQMKLSDLFLKNIASVQSIEDLWLQDVRTTDDGMPFLASMKHLTNLYLARSLVTDAGLQDLMKSTSLLNLDLDFCPNVSRRGALLLRKRVPPINVKLHYQD